MNEKFKAIRIKFRRAIRKLEINDLWIPKVSKRSGYEVETVGYKEVNDFTEYDRQILNIPPTLRTVEERKHMVKVFTDLDCLSEFSPKIRARLSRSAYFAEMEKGRVLIRENTEPLFVYFLLGGKVDVFRTVYSKRKKKFVRKSEMLKVFGPGTCVGQYEFIMQTTRTNTITALSHVDLLAVYEHEFKEILLPTLIKDWNFKMQVLHALPYFDHFNENQMKEACKLGSLHQYNVYDTIHTVDKGVLSNVFFVISGECMVVQNLRMQVNGNDANKTYKLIEMKEENGDQLSEAGSSSLDLISDANNDDADEIDELLRSETSNIFDIKAAFENCGMRPPTRITKTLSKPKTKKKPRKTYRYFLDNQDDRSVNSEHEINIKIIMQMSRPKMKTEAPNLEERWQGSSRSDDLNYQWRHQEMPKRKTLREFTVSTSSSSSTGSEIFTDGVDISAMGDGELEDYLFNTDVDIETESDEDRNKNSFDYFKGKETLNLLHQSTLVKSIDSNIKVEANEEVMKQTDLTLSITSLTKSHSTISILSVTSSRLSNQFKLIENHLIDVGTIRDNGVFGLGEKSVHRFIIARSNVQCLQLPRFWLFNKLQNPRGLWQTRRRIINTSLPTREKIYQIFVKEQQWPKFKNKFVKSVLDPESRANETRLHDLPSMLLWL